MNLPHLFHAKGVAPLATIVLALPACLGAQTTIAQAGIESYYNSTYALYALDGSTSYVNSGDLNFGTTSSGDNLAIGYSTTNNYLTISAGTVTDYRGTIGHSSGSTGSVTVTGTGSAWINSSYLYIGNIGTGTLKIENGGTVSDTYGYIGSETGSNGTVAVTGTGSRWTNSNTLRVGSSGTGTLTIEKGGTVSNTYAYIGYSSGSNGTVTVTGAGSVWKSSNTLYVGSSGTGTLTIENGALVTATTVSVGSGSAIYLGGGYLALAGTGTTDLATLEALLNGGTKIYAWDGTTSQYVLLDGVTTDSNYYGNYVTLTYYSDITTYDALDSYNLSGGYTVLTSLYSIPEPATWALFGGLGALGLALLRRKRK
jgi:T5SS/PEP-CTERM-associated repeat protein